MKRKNRLREIVQQKCEKVNLTKKRREKKWRAKYELQKIADTLHVSWFTVWDWYLNKHQPRGDSQAQLASYYKIDPKKFYYFE